MNRHHPLANCEECPLFERDAFCPSSGPEKADLVIVGEAPGRNEVRQQEPFIGASGQLLNMILENYDYKREDIFITNTVLCQPEDNANPPAAAVKACRERLHGEVQHREPSTLMAMGNFAARSVLQTSTGITALRAGPPKVSSDYPGIRIIPTFHPSYILRRNDKVLNRIFEKHLKMAIKKSKAKPWKKVPDYESQIDVIMNPSEAAKEIYKMISQGGPVAFDYEANCLKPEGEGTKIVSCSICHKGKKTIAYPWQGEVKHATDILLKSSMPKIASNIKFEDRWTRAKMGHPVKNWWWDTMIAAHVLDNSPKVTGLKFQAFVLLGAESYDDIVAPFLKSVKNSRFNRIHEVDLKDLLLYNGLDSLLEYKVAMKQMKLFENRREVKNG